MKILSRLRLYPTKPDDVGAHNCALATLRHYLGRKNTPLRLSALIQLQRQAVGVLKEGERFAGVLINANWLYRNVLRC